MYTTQQSDMGPSYWDILDPEGDYIATVYGSSAAEALLSHLNKG